MSIGRRDRSALIADIGGTWARFARVPAGGNDAVDERIYRTAQFPDFTTAAQTYLAAGGERPAIALCAIATPVLGDYLRMTNQRWAFSVEAARRELGLERLRFINDFAAQAMAMPHLPANAFTRVCGPPPVATSPMTILGPGTGLGVATLVPMDGRWLPLPGEGGHATFTPINDREVAVAARLRERHGHCSAERVISALGLEEVHNILRQLDGLSAVELSAEAISQRAARGECPHCREAIQLLCDGLATLAGDLALTVDARGGIYLAGGVLRKLGALFDFDRFRARFVDKGRYRDYLEHIGVYRVDAEHPALLGLARGLRSLL